MSSFSVTSSREGYRSFIEHDNRNGRGMRNYGPKSRQSGNTRGFKKKYNKMGGHFKPRYQGGPNPRSRLLADDDEDMNDRPGTSSHQRYTPYGQRDRGQSSRGGRPNGRGRRGRLSVNEASKRLGLPVSGTVSSSVPTSSWFKITLPYGKKYDKAFLLTSLTSQARPFVPYQYQCDSASATFYVNDKGAADALRNASRRLTMPDGYKLDVIVRPSTQPNIPMKPEVVEKLKLCMSNRYNTNTKTLNLSALHTDNEFTSVGLHLALNKHTVAHQVVSIIVDNIPELECLDLSNNKLFTTESFISLQGKVHGLTRLNLAQNHLKTELDLNPFKKFALEELWLDRNPLCDKYSEGSSYISAIRKRFPKVVRLDGHDLPPIIEFEVETSQLPPTLGNHFGGNAQVQSVVCRFLEQYFSIYDSDNRQSLLDAYHDQAVFSLCVPFIQGIQTRGPSIDNLMFRESRNLKKVTESFKRQKLLKQGKLTVVAFLNELPSTKHDPNAFVVDVTYFDANVLSFVVNGLFKEGSDNSNIRNFSRAFVTVPQGSGIVIVNEEYTISKCTIEQQKRAFKPVPSSSASTSSAAAAVGGAAAAVPSNALAAAVAAATASPSASSSSIQPAVLATPEQQQQLVMQFTQQSGMTLEWSRKCLQENEWDFEKSAHVFTDLQAKGAIPPEAFIK